MNQSNRIYNYLDRINWNRIYSQEMCPRNRHPHVVERREMADFEIFNEIEPVLPPVGLRNLFRYSIKHFSIGLTW